MMTRAKDVRAKDMRSNAVRLLALLVVAGCASTQVTGGREYRGERLARPDRIIVHDFAATHDDLPSWSAAARYAASASESQTPEAIEAGRRLGGKTAEALVDEIRRMGLPAVRASGQPAPRVDDIVLVGYFGSLDEGSATKRVVLGFGSGGAELQTRVEGYVQRETELVHLGFRDVNAGGGKTPGVALPVAVTVATANPVGLIVGGAVKAGGEITGSSTIDGSAKRTAKKVAEELRVAFRREGWI